MPWRVAKVSDALYAAYATACAVPHKENVKDPVYPPTIHNLSPRACRSIIRKMLEPDPKHRVAIEEVMVHPWIQGIEVCHAVARPAHVHAHALQQAHAQLTVS
jgi:protein-serine/threonine kinase